MGYWTKVLERSIELQKTGVDGDAAFKLARHQVDNEQPQLRLEHRAEQVMALVDRHEGRRPEVAR